MAQVGHEDARTQAYPGGALGRQRQRHPHVGALLGRVVEPRPLVTDLFGQRDVVGR